MKKRIIKLMCCPKCKGDLKLIEKEADGGEVFEGMLECGDCGKSCEVTASVPRMIVDLGDRDELSESWGFQWAVQADGKLETDTYYGEKEEDEIGNFFKYLGISPADLQGKTILDAGCGCGRLTKALGKYSAEVVGIDIASSIERINDYCSSEDNVHIMQADIVDIPFRDESFDYVWSKLAVCYTHEPEQAFANLAGLVKPAGKLFVSVPDKDDLSFVIKLKDMLKIAHRIPRKLLLYLCWTFAPLLFLAKKLSGNPATSVRVNAFFLFNALHPSFMKRHSNQDVREWFKKADFTEISRVNGMPRLVHYRGRKKRALSRVSA